MIFIQRVVCFLWMIPEPWRRNTRCDTKNLSHECYHINIKEICDKIKYMYYKHYKCKKKKKKIVLTPDGSRIFPKMSLFTMCESFVKGNNSDLYFTQFTC
jgi:hypothetical protein